MRNYFKLLPILLGMTVTETGVINASALGDSSSLNVSISTVEDESKGFKKLISRQRRHLANMFVSNISGPYERMISEILICDEFQNISNKEMLLYRALELSLAIKCDMFADDRRLIVPLTMGVLLSTLNTVEPKSLLEYDIFNLIRRFLSLNKSTKVCEEFVDTIVGIFSYSYSPFHNSNPLSDRKYLYSITRACEEFKTSILESLGKPSFAAVASFILHAPDELVEHLFPIYIPTRDARSLIYKFVLDSKTSDLKYINNIIHSILDKVSPYLEKMRTQVQISVETTQENNISSTDLIARHPTIVEQFFAGLHNVQSYFENIFLHFNPISFGVFCMPDDMYLLQTSDIQKLLRGNFSEDKNIFYTEAGYQIKFAK